MKTIAKNILIWLADNYKTNKIKIILFGPKIHILYGKKPLQGHLCYKNKVCRVNLKNMG